METDGDILGQALSGREEGILRRVVQGESAPEIAALLGVSARTVERCKARALEKLGLKDRAEIIRYAVQKGWLRDP